jgi:hypothetical protein
MQIAFEVNDWTLSTAIREIWVLTFVKQVERDRTRAEVKRHTFTDVKTSMAIDLKLETPLLDFGHTDRCAGGGIPFHHHSIAV